MSKNKIKPKLFIYVEGGLIQSMLSNVPIEIMILDGDTDGMDETFDYKDSDGCEFQAYEAIQIRTDVEPEEVKNYFKQRKRTNKRS